MPRQQAYRGEGPTKSNFRSVRVGGGHETLSTDLIPMLSQGRDWSKIRSLNLNGQFEDLRGKYLAFQGGATVGQS